ncbi:hypothetical protein ACIA5D_50880 [Actinoplanes sp. NPDC051513]|uniref:hypothetical protein n=1 Tax=Actinoplanes sp. NPDC051513 TaxID=3363908 RepID=UPI003797FBF7
MTQQIGDRATFAVEVGEVKSPSLRIVDLWAAGRWLTTDDNVVQIPSFSRHMRSDAQRVRQGDVRPCSFSGRAPEDIFRLLNEDETEFREQFWFMRSGETVDNVSRSRRRAWGTSDAETSWPRSLGAAGCTVVAGGAGVQRPRNGRDEAGPDQFDSV